MAILPIYLYGQTVLRKKAKAVLAVDDRIIGFVNDMFDTMNQANGIGLAATQVGSLYRILVLDLSGMENEPDPKPMVLINPVVVEEEGNWTMEEGCLSIPDLRDDVDRPERIRVRYRDLEFVEQEMTATDLLGRVILHEIDHLNGVLFVDRLVASKQKLLTGRLNKIRKGEVDVAYPIVSEVETT